MLNEYTVKSVEGHTTCTGCIYHNKIHETECDYSQFKTEPSVVPCVRTTIIVLVHKLTGERVIPEELVKYYAK